MTEVFEVTVPLRHRLSLKLMAFSVAANGCECERH